MSKWTNIRDSVIARITSYIWKGGPIDGYKTPLALIFLAFTKLGFLPEINIEDGISLDEVSLIWSAIDAKLKDYGIRKS